MEWNPPNYVFICVTTLEIDSKWVLASREWAFQIYMESESSSLPGVKKWYSDQTVNNYDTGTKGICIIVFSEKYPSSQDPEIKREN